MLEIDKRSDGRIKHEFYWAQSLVKAKETLDAVKAGTASVGDATAVVYLPARFPIWQFSQLLFVGGDDQWGAIQAYNEMYDTVPACKEEFDKQGVQFLSTSPLTPTIIMASKPLHKPADFKGLRLRAVGPLAKFVTAAGGTAVPTTFYEVPEALARGMLDGTQSYVYASHAYKHYEHCKFLTFPGYAHIFIDYWLNLDTKKKLGPELYKLYEDTWRTLYPELCIKYHDEDYAMQIKTFKDAGVKIDYRTPEEQAKFKEVAASLIDEYYKKMTELGVDGKAILAQYEKLYKKHERK